jgi:hypothetical protein
MFDIVSQFRLGLLACSTTLAVIFPCPRCGGYVAYFDRPGGDIQLIIPYALYWEALLWIRRTHHSLTVDDWSLEKSRCDIPKNTLEGHVGQAQ